MSTYEESFANMVQAARDVVKGIDTLPADKVDERLAALRDGLREALAQYDCSKSFDPPKEEMFE